MSHILGGVLHFQEIDSPLEPYGEVWAPVANSSQAQHGAPGLAQGRDYSRLVGINLSSGAVLHAYPSIFRTSAIIGSSTIWTQFCALIGRFRIVLAP